MFKKKYRLNKNINLLGPKILSTPLFTVRIAKNNLSYSRFGFIVSKKIDKRASARNSIKRRFRSCIEIVLDRIKKEYDMLFLLKREAGKKAQDEFCRSLHMFLNKEKLLT